MTHAKPIIDHSTNPHRIIREKERLAITGVSRSQWYRLENGGEVPRRIKISKTADGIAHGWTYGEIIEWIESRKAARTSKGGA